MSEPKTFASLSPTLLARKGAAKPAMRRQQAQVNMFHDAMAGTLDQDDLGWNDMGHDTGHAPVELVAVDAGFEPAAEVVTPEVVRQQEAIAERVVAAAPDLVADLADADPVVAAKAILAQRAAAAPVAAAPVVAPAKAPRRTAAPSRRSALGDGRRAAFTLRVDSERHLKLRLACTVRGRSAQQLVTEALDRLLDELPEISSLAAQLARKH